MADPRAYVGTRVNWAGKIVGQPEVYETFIAFQANNSEVDQPFVVGTTDFSLQTWMKSGSYVRVIGEVVDEFRGTTGVGVAVSAPIIKAALVSKMRRADAEAPALNILTYGKTTSQFGFDVRLDRVELALAETRVYLTLTNHRSDRVHLFTFDAKLLKGAEQFDKRSVFESDEEIPSELLPGVEASGAIVFPEIPDGVSGARVYLGTPSAATDLPFQEVVLSL